MSFFEDYVAPNTTAAFFDSASSNVLWMNGGKPRSIVPSIGTRYTISAYKVDTANIVYNSLLTTLKSHSLLNKKRTKYSYNIVVISI